MSRKNLLPYIALAITLTQLLNGCGGLKGKQQVAASEAMTALRKIEAAVQVGVSYQQYGVLLIDAKSKVNDANAVLPDGELKSKLNAAMDAYADAGQVWGIKISGPNLLPNTEPGASLMRKYNLKTHTISAAALTYIDPDEAMQAAWGAAMGHLLIVQKLLDEQ
jgi:hypothetical protein